jgi:hypothetical protein
MNNFIHEGKFNIKKQGISFDKNRRCIYVLKGVIYTTLQDSSNIR